MATKVPTPLSAGEETLALHIRASSIPAGNEPRREYPFHATRKFRFDFCWPSIMLAVEVDGGTWKKSRHTTAKGFEKDCEKLNAAALDGWMVLRFTTDMVKSGAAIITIEEAFWGAYDKIAGAE